MNAPLFVAALMLAGYGDYEEAVKWIEGQGGDVVVEGYVVILPETCTDCDLAYLDAFPNLGLLRFRGDRVTDAGMDAVARRTTLLDLELDNTKITDKGLCKLQKLDKLASLSLQGTRVTDVGLQAISKLSALKALSLDETDITDSGLCLLESLKNLRYLSLSGCQSVSDKGIARLKKALPNCEIRR